MHFLSSDQQSGIHCLIICGIQLLTPEDVSVRRTFKALAVSALEVFKITLRCTNRHLLTYLIPRNFCTWCMQRTKPFMHDVRACVCVCVLYRFVCMTGDYEIKQK